MSLPYERFDELQDKREQIIDVLKNGAMRLQDVGEKVALKKNALDYHVVKLIGLGLIEEKYDGKAAFIGLTAKCRKTDSQKLKIVLQENGRKRKSHVARNILAVVVIATIVLSALIGASSYYSYYPSKLSCALYSPNCPLVTVKPIELQIVGTNKEIIIGDSSNPYRVYDARTVLDLNATTSTQGLSFDTVKVFLDDGRMIGVLYPSEIVSGRYTLEAGSNAVIVILKMPIDLGTHVCVVMYDQQSAITGVQGDVYYWT